jgi:hypothetical protein
MGLQISYSMNTGISQEVAHIDTTEVLGITSEKVYEGEKCHKYSPDIHQS